MLEGAEAGRAGQVLNHTLKEESGQERLRVILLGVLCYRNELRTMLAVVKNRVKSDDDDFELFEGFCKSTVEALSDMFKFKSDEIHPDINTRDIRLNLRIRSN